MGLAVIVGWLLTQIGQRQCAYAGPGEKTEKNHQRESTLTSQSKHQKDRRGILSLATELLVAVAIKLGQRYLKSWRSAFIARLENSPQSPSSSQGFSITTVPSAFSEPKVQRFEDPPEKLKPSKSHQNNIVSLFKKTANEWIQDKCPQLGAALAYFTVFSLAPLVLVLLALFGLIFGGSDQAREKITEQLKYLVDPSGIKVIQDIAASASKPESGVLATVIGVILGLFGASGVFGQLQDALNTIWGLKPKPGAGVWGFLRARFFSFAMVGGVCFLLLVSLTVESVLKGLNAYLEKILPGGQVLGLGLFFVFDLAVVISLFAMIFRYLPDARLGWRDVWVGATLTAVLFVIGKFLLGLYLGSGAAGSAYGAASSLITLLLWIYYAAQILLFGAEFTQVYANTYGSHIEPEKHAVRVQRTEIELPR